MRFLSDAKVIAHFLRYEVIFYVKQSFFNLGIRLLCSASLKLYWKHPYYKNTFEFESLDVI